MKDEDQAGIGHGRRRSGGSSGGPQWMKSPLIVIIAINVVVFLLQYVAPLDWRQVTLNGRTGEVPWGATSRDFVFGSGEVWTLITYMFVHGGPVHLALNMFMIFFVGRMLIQLAGEKHFLWVYAIAGVGGALAQMLISKDPLVGASGSAFGLVIALAVIIPDMEMRMLLFFVLPVRLRMRNLAYGLVGISVIFLMLDLVASGNAKIPMVTGVGHGAHLGGALFGWLYAWKVGLGGSRWTREKLAKQRASNEAKPKRKKKLKTSAKTTTATIVSIKDGKEVPLPAEGTKDPLRAQNDEILDKMNREGRGQPTEEERKILEENTRKLNEKSARKK